MTYTNTFSSVLDQISDVSYYTSYEDAKDTDVYSSILNEMKESAEDLGLPKNRQGWGRIHIGRLTR